MDHIGGTTADATASWTFANLAPGTYTVAVTYVPGSFYNSGTFQYVYYYGSVPYSVLGDNGVNFGATTVYQGSTPSSFTDADGTQWQSLTGTYTITGTTLTVQMNDNINSTFYHINAAAVRIQRIGGNGGGDDNYHLQSGSPAIDAGDPASAFANEPSPNGGRINLGYDGKATASAATSARPRWSRCWCASASRSSSWARRSPSAIGPRAPRPARRTRSRRCPPTAASAITPCSPRRALRRHAGGVGNVNWMVPSDTTRC